MEAYSDNIMLVTSRAWGCNIATAATLFTDLVPSDKSWNLPVHFPQSRPTLPIARFTRARPIPGALAQSQPASSR